MSNEGSEGKAQTLQQLHQKLLSFEAKYLKLFQSSQEAVPRRISEKQSCMTSPLPRRPLPMPLPVGVSPQGPASNITDFGDVRIRTHPEWPSHSNRQSVEAAAENERKLNEIKKKAGRLLIGDNEYPAKMEDFEKLGALGSGTCGTVVKMRFKPSGDIVAVKQMVFSGNREEIKRVLMDLDVVLRSHDCPYIVHCYGCLINNTDVWLCMELMATCLGKLLKTIKSPIPENVLGALVVSIVRALFYLKEKKIIHRDIKPSNILLDYNGKIKLCDFGISGLLDDSKAKSRNAGVAAYMSPERIESKNYDIRADVWSLGITLVELSTGKLPYADCIHDFHVLAKVVNEDPPKLPADMDFTPMFRDFVENCLQKQLELRPKYDALVKHPFFQTYASQDDEQRSSITADWFRKATTAAH